MANLGINSVRLVLRRLTTERIAPAVIADKTTEFVDRLAELNSGTEDSLSTFFCDVPLHALYRELDDRILPDSVARLIKSMRVRHEELAFEKEQHIRNRDFQAAVDCRDKRYELVAEGEKLITNQIEISPDAVKTALRNIGYAGILPGDPS